MKKNLIRVPNSIFDYKLKATELAIVLYFLAIKPSSNGYFEVTQDKISLKTNLSVTAIKNAVKILEQKKLLQVKRTKRYGRYLTSKYKLNIKVGNKNFFCVSKDILKFKREITVHTLQVYLYLRKCANSDDMAYPSLKKMSKELEISKTTVIKAKKVLESLGLLKKLNYIKKDKSYGCSHHKIKLNVVKKGKFNKVYKIIKDKELVYLKIDNSSTFPPLKYNYYLLN